MKGASESEFLDKISWNTDLQPANRVNPNREVHPYWVWGKYRMQSNMNDGQRLNTLRNTLLNEIFFAFGMAKDGWARRNLWPLFWLPAHIFTKVCLGFDEIVAREGFDAAARRVLPRFVKGSISSGQERIPGEGPLLIVSNHPGSVDGLVIASYVSRPDFRIIASQIPFIMNLPHTAKHMIYSSLDTFDRMGVLRASVDHLQRGGAMLVYPSGHVDPDPGLLPGAEENLGEWSRSVELLLRKAPQTRLVVCIVSNLVGPGYYRSPIMKIQRGYTNKQKLAEFIQLMQQMVIPGSVDVVPRVSFDFPQTLDQLQDRMSASVSLMQAIITRARQVLSDHVTSDFAHLERSRA